MNWSAETRGFTVTLHVFCTQNLSTGSENLESLRSLKVPSQLKWNLLLMLFPSTWSKWTPRWCATTSNSVLTDSSYALAATVTSKLGTRSNGWKQSASKAKQTSSRNASENTPNQVLVLIAPTKPLPLTLVFDPPLSILHLSPPPCMIHVTYLCSSWNTHIPTHVFSWGFTEKQLHRVWRMSLKSNEYFGGRGLHPLQPNTISPSGSVMII